MPVNLTGQHSTAMGYAARTMLYHDKLPLSTLWFTVGITRTTAIPYTSALRCKARELRLWRQPTLWRSPGARYCAAYYDSGARREARTTLLSPLRPGRRAHLHRSSRSNRFGPWPSLTCHLGGVSTLLGMATRSHVRCNSGSMDGVCVSSV